MKVIVLAVLAIGAIVGLILTGVNLNEVIVTYKYVGHEIGLFEVVTPMQLLIYIVIPFHVTLISTAFMILIGIKKIGNRKA